MKFKNYLNENERDEIHIVDLIENECQPFLKEWHHNILWSGRRNSKQFENGTFYVKKIRTDRKPKDTPLKLHKLLDLQFKKKFGKNLRSESMFVTWDYLMAEDYGKLYMVFPKGKFEIYWSPIIEDLLLDIPSSIVKNDHDAFEIASRIKDLIQRWTDDAIKNFEDFYRMEDGNPDHKTKLGKYQSVEEWLNFQIKKIVDTYKKGNLIQAVSSKNEVMLVCNEVFLIDQNYYPNIKGILMDRGY